VTVFREILNSKPVKQNSWI